MRPANLVLLVVLSALGGGAVSATLLSRQLAGETGPGADLAEARSRLAALERELAELRGKQEEQAFALALLGEAGLWTGGAAAPTPAEFEAALEAVLARRADLLRSQGEADPTRPASQGENDGSARTAEDFFAQLAVEGLSEAEYQRLWQEVRSAGLTDDVVGAFEDLAESNPTDPRAQFAVGLAYLQKAQDLSGTPEGGRFGVQADASFDRALELDPDNWEARFVKGVALSFWPPISGKRSEAIRQFEILRQRQAQLPRHDGHAQTTCCSGTSTSRRARTPRPRPSGSRARGSSPRTRS